jgi:hypothetical protein
MQEVGFPSFDRECHDLPQAEQNRPTLPVSVISFSLSCPPCLCLIFILKFSLLYNCLQLVVTPTRALKPTPTGNAYLPERSPPATSVGQLEVAVTFWPKENEDNLTAIVLRMW